MKTHMKRQTAPVTWRIDRKGSKFIVRPNPGKKMVMSMPIALIFKDVLNYCKTTREVKNILKDKEVMVDGIRRKDHRYPVGFMDVLSLPVADEAYRMLISTKGRLTLVKVGKDEADRKLCRIINKTKIKKGFQLNLDDGRNIMMAEDKGYKVGDVVRIKVPSQEIAEHLKLAEGHYCIISGGKYTGHHGKIEKIDGRMVSVKDASGNEFTSDQRNIFVIGKDKPEIKLVD